MNHVITITSATLMSGNGTVATYKLPTPITVRPGDSLTITWTVSRTVGSQFGGAGGAFRRAYDPSRDVLLPEE